jgi:hypothetical protein
MTTIASRFAYRLLLRLHPAPFRDEFGAEMLWIFEEDREHGGYLFFDGALSLLRQRCRLRKDPGQLSIASGTIISNPGIGVARLLQSGFLCCLIFFSCAHLLRHPNPFSVSVKWSDRMSCYTLSLQAPSHAEVVLGSLP